jgi:hypothetical protein
MNNGHRVPWLVVLMFIAAGAACGEDEDDGIWTRDPGQSPTSPIAEVTTVPVEGLSLFISPQPLDFVPASSLPDYLVPCDMAPEFSIPIHTDQVPSYLDERGWVCLGEQEEDAQPILCKQVTAFEARAASVASCYDKMYGMIASRSSEMLGPHWWATVLPLLPAAWSRTPEQVTALTHRVSDGMVDLLTGATDQTSAPGAPLCFPLGAYTADPEQAGLISAKKVASLIQDTRANLEEVAAALVRGVNVEVTSDLKLRLAARFADLPPPVSESLECTFQKH